MTLRRRSFEEYPAHNQCYFFSLDSNLDLKNSNFNLIQTNTHSVKDNLDEFLCKIQNLGAYFHVVLLSETWIAHELVYKKFTMLVDSDLESNLIADLLVNFKIYESIGVEIKINWETQEIIGVYRPPSS